MTSREPQQDRSRVTRLKLLEATIDCLAYEGWTATTVGVVAGRAGVSRGAAQHHFPTREDLITAALDYMFESRTREALAEAEAVSAGAVRSTQEIVVLLVEYYTGTLFKAALQVWTAAAADEGLRRRVLPLELKFARQAHQMAVQALGVDDTDPVVHRLVQATLDLARGLGLADVLSDDSKRRGQIVRAWATQLEMVLHESAVALS
ncbi:MAG: TetR/AcrR family transcriptional regulator [Mycobacteriaceae bacterium]